MIDLVYDDGQPNRQGYQVQRQLIDHHTARARQLAWLALLLTTVVLLTPGAVLVAAHAFAEPAIEALRSWKLRWWPWPASDTTSSGPGVDKIVHAFLFGVCAILASRAWQNLLTVTSIALLLLAFAVLTELAQHVIPGRGMSLGDIVADTVGIMAGLGIRQWLRPGHQSSSAG